LAYVGLLGGCDGPPGAGSSACAFAEAGIPLPATPQWRSLPTSNRSELPGSALAAYPATVFDPVAYPGAPAGDVDLYVKSTVFPDAFANDLPAKRGVVLAASQRPLTVSAAAEPSGPPAWETLPSWYLVGTRDNVLPSAQQRAMAERAGSTTVAVKAGHLSMLSRPAAVTDLIVAAARSLG